MTTPIVIGDTPESMELGWIIDGKHYGASDIKNMEKQLRRMSTAIHYATSYLEENSRNSIGCGSKAHNELKEALLKTNNYSLEQYNAEVGQKAIQTLVDHIKSGKVGTVLVDSEVVGTHVIESYLADLQSSSGVSLQNNELEDVRLQAISAYGDGWYDGYIKALKMRDEFDSKTADYALMESEDAEGKSHYGQANKASERLKHLEAKAGRAGFDAGWTARTDRANSSFKQAADEYVASIAKAGK